MNICDRCEPKTPSSTTIIIEDESSSTTNTYELCAKCAGELENNIERFMHPPKMLESHTETPTT